MIVRLPFPSPELMPNRKNGQHWAATNRLKVKARDDAYWLAKSAPKADYSAQYLPVSIMFCMPDKRRRDIDNLLAACKPALDGIAEALGVDDSRFKPLLVDWVEGDKPGAVIVAVGVTINRLHGDVLA